MNCGVLSGGSLLMLPLRNQATRNITGVCVVRREKGNFDDVDAALREGVQRQAIAAMIVAQNTARQVLASQLAKAVAGASK